jgi:hypothetical protein
MRIVSSAILIFGKYENNLCCKSRGFCSIFVKSFDNIWYNFLGKSLFSTENPIFYRKFDICFKKLLQKVHFLYENCWNW